MDENVRYNMRRVKNNVDYARSQMISVLNILKADINVNGAALENSRINSATYNMNSVSNTVSYLIRNAK